MRARLVPPDVRYAPSYVAALREGFSFATQPSAQAEVVSAIKSDFAGYIRRITDQHGTMTLPTGAVVPKVPFSVHWLVEEGKFIGQANLRHALNRYLRQEGGHVGYAIRPSRRRQGYGRLILKLALEECRSLGMAQVLITCDDDNVGSARIIEANGGLLEDVIDHPTGRGRVRRYWIDLSERLPPRPGRS